MLGLWLAGAAAAQTVVSASYDEPVTRYDHGVLGDAIEWGTLRLGLTDGRMIAVRLSKTRVFEDLAPRLVDLGDRVAAMVVETDVSLGARLALYGPDGLIAAGPFIGRRHRWLAPVGAADLDGDGRIEVAYVDRPHLARVLRVLRYVPGQSALQPVADASGFANHRIGRDRIAGGLRDCGAGPEMVLPDGDWEHVMAVRLVQESLTVATLGPYDAGALDRALRCQ
ncbi:hypothetical protein AL036_04580 [Salipiger aestuarii]|uniref:VCBS repeat-containing protein n=1 Tax=Salipiger aestuarii TaxID=568098 RepID=UPI00123B1B5F|nr:VCBS repeat-containing protein [Salipiger aestuarii]KAA8609328.1 hypothetical protein AL036_04580 [Salipiger aestuarii]